MSNTLGVFTRRFVLILGLILVTVLLTATVRLTNAQTTTPIDPTSGEQNLLDIINAMPLNDIDSALDNFPVPYVVIAQAGTGPVVIANNRAGAPTRVNADSSKATGKGGYDIEVEVNTQLSTNNQLRLDIKRLGSAPFATDLEVVIAFPFDAFNGESLPGAPNLFMGYQTTGNGGIDGGIAPLSETIIFTPTTLAGTTHDFTTTMATIGASNPLRFVMGHFDGTNLTGVLNAAAMSALMEPVPASVAMTVSVDESALSVGPGGTDSTFGLNWTASTQSKVTFEYIEEESAPTGEVDYGTTVVFDKMPTSEQFTLVLDESAESLTLQHAANSVVNEINVWHTRDDGLTVSAAARQVPTQVELALDLDGAATLDVNASTLDLIVTANQVDGFAGTDEFFGYLLGHVEVGITDAVDLTAAWDAATRSFSVQATNPGEQIGSISLLAGDDDQLELPPGSPGPWSDTERHVFSLVDDGTHGTVAGRLANVMSADLSLTAATLTEAYDLNTSEPTPLTAYLRTTPSPAPGSSIIPGRDIEATCNLEDVPDGDVSVTVKFPDEVGINLPDPIESIHCFGHLYSLNFDVLATKVPKIAEWKFNPTGSLTIKAEDGTGPNSAQIGAVAIRFWDTTPSGSLPYGSGLLGVPLKDARARADLVPSMGATWSDGAGSTNVHVDTNATDRFLGGVQVTVSTIVEFNGPLPIPDASTGHYLRFIDDGVGGKKSLYAGVFGIDTIDYTSNDANIDFTVDADLARQIAVELDSAFGGRFFSNYDVDLELSVNKAPPSLELHTNLKEALSWKGSAPFGTVQLDGTLDLTNNNGEDLTDLFVSVETVPSEVTIDFDATNGQGKAEANGDIDRIVIELQSTGKIFGGKYKWFNAVVNDISTKWTMDAAVDPEAETGYAKIEAAEPLGTVNVILSNETKQASADNLDPFKNASASTLVSRSSFQKVIDDRYFASGVQTRLNDLYGSTIRLDGTPLEDHVVMRKSGSLNYLAVQFTGFKGLEATVTETSVKATLKAPSDGTHPLFVGQQTGESKFLVVQVEDVPDEISIDVLADKHAYFDASSSPGRIDVYQGPLPSVGEGTNALRAILKNTPSSVHLDYGDLDSFPGGGSFQASQQFEALVLVQTASSRVVVGLQMEDFAVSYGLDGPGYDACDEVAGQDTCYGLFRLQGGINAKGNVSNQGVSGFFVLYDLEGSPKPLSDGAATPDGAEFVPRLTFLLKNFTSFSTSFEIQFDPTAIPGDTPLWPIDIELNIDGPHADAFVFDFWDLGFAGVELAGVTLGANDPDYINNNPWHIVPLFHGFGSHFDPY